MSTSVIRRRRRQSESDTTRQATPNDDDAHCNTPPTTTAADAEEHMLLEMNVMEKILLMGLKDTMGHTSYWNDCLSPGLRGCALIELALRNRIELEPPVRRKRGLLTRAVQIKDSSPTGDVVLDETLKHIKESRPLQPVMNWVNRLSGMSWNPMLNRKYQVLNVRERVAKSLVEKGVLQTRRDNLVVFNLTTHPIRDPVKKFNMITHMQQVLLSNWNNDIHRLDKRDISVLILAHYSDVLENALASLNDRDYELAVNRHRCLLEINFKAESARHSNYCHDVMWAVFEGFVHR